MPLPAVAYVLWYFPKLSETFVIEELVALEKRGVHPLIFSREHPGADPDDPELPIERAQPLLARTAWLRDAPARRQVGAMVRAVVRHPVTMLACFGVVLATRKREAMVNLWFAAVLAEEVRRHDVRYLHAHFADNAAELTYFASRLTGVPFGVTVHAADIYLGRFLCRKLDAAALRVTVCEYNLGQIEARCPGVPSDEFVLKYAGVDTDRFRLDVPRPARPARSIVAIGRLTPKKGFDLLVRAMVDVGATVPDARCRIVGVGGSEPDLRRLIAELGLDDVVELLGARTPAQIVPLLTDADLLVAPCTIAPWGDRDSMPVVVKEAMAMELPVIATDDFGIPEMVTPESGILVPRDDVGGLAAAILKVLAMDAGTRAAMGRAGRAVVEQRFREDAGAEVLARRFEALTR